VYLAYHCPIYVVPMLLMICECDHSLLIACLSDIRPTIACRPPPGILRIFSQISQHCFWLPRDAAGLIRLYLLLFFRPIISKYFPPDDCCGRWALLTILRVPTTDSVGRAEISCDGQAKNAKIRRLVLFATNKMQSRPPVFTDA
jgi:hypothetical protein